MKRKIKKRLSDINFFTCAICSNAFEICEDADKISPEKKALCGRCIKGSVVDVLKRIDSRINFLTKIKKIVAKIKL